jgi:hypothetical protein
LADVPLRPHDSSRRDDGSDSIFPVTGFVATFSKACFTVCDHFSLIPALLPPSETPSRAHHAVADANDRFEALRVTRIEPVTRLHTRGPQQLPQLESSLRARPPDY